MGCAHRFGVHEQLICIISAHAGEGDDDCIGLGSQPDKIWRLTPLQLVLSPFALVHLQMDRPSLQLPLYWPKQPSEDGPFYRSQPTCR